MKKCSLNNKKQNNSLVVLLIFSNFDNIVTQLSQIFSIFATAIRKERKDILLNGLSITTREKRAIQLKLGLPHYGRRLPISVVVCGEPRDLWRMSAPFVVVINVFYKDLGI